MAWCPICKNEYREGIKVCADCGETLVETLSENPMVSVTFGDEKQMMSLKKFLEYSGVKEVDIRYDELENVYELKVRQKDRKAAAEIAKVFLVKEYEATLEQSGVTKREATPAPKSTSHHYQSSAAKAEDNRTSAWTLLLIGTLGVVLLILSFVGIIPLKLGNSYLFYGVMGAVFVLFIVMGFVSMRTAKIFAKSAESENSLRETMLKWCKENLQADDIDKELYMQDVSEEILYFRRYEKLKEILNRQFMNLDQGFLDQFIDETVYDMVFEKGNNETA